MRIKDNAINATIKFAQKFTNVNENYLTEQLYQHPYYPSLLSISEVLQFEGIQNFAAKVKSQDLSQMSFPVLAHLHINGGVFIIIQKLINNHISYWIDGKVIKESVDQFNEKWSNTVLIPQTVASPSNLINVSDKKWRSILIAFLSTFITGFLIWNAANFTTLSPFIFVGQLISLLLGLSTTTLIVIQSIDQRNPLVQQLCGGSKKTDCNHILGSDAAKINSWLGWADMGLIYYAGSFILLLNSNTNSSMPLLCAINILSLPFTFYSVYYQWRIAKNWCRLCLYIQALLWFQSGFSIYYLLNLIEVLGLNLFDLIQSVSIFILPGFIWLLVKPQFQEFNKIAPLKKQLNRLKFEIKTFKYHLFNQVKYVAPVDISFGLGNPTSTLEITMVSNPFCNPCSKAHMMLSEWLTKGLDFKLNIVFLPGNQNELKYQFIHHLFAIKQLDYAKAIEALHTWFDSEKRDLNDWKSKFPTDQTNNQLVNTTLDKQNDWCKMTEIMATPTFLINGFLMPPNYQLRDIKYILLNWDN